MRERELEAQAKKLRKQLRIIVNTLDARKTKRELPKLKAKYEGKYFKYRNSYSCPQSESDYWFIYFKVLKVGNERSITALRFEIDNSSKIEIEIKEVYTSSLQTEITEKEFLAARDRVKINCLAALA